MSMQDVSVEPELPTASATTAVPSLAKAERTRTAELARDILVLLPAIVLGILFAATLSRDPAPAVTGSQSPFTDEAWNLLNARNLVLLGTWATDDWALHLVNLPFSVIAALVFEVFGVGIVQGRAMTAAAIVLTVAIIGLVLRRRLGLVPALVGAASLAAAPLVVYYGRLAYLEDLVVLFLTVGALLSLASIGPRPGWAGLAAGAFLAAAVGVKPIAIVPVVGLLVGVALAGGMGGAPAVAVRRWIAGAVAVLLVAAAGWLVLVLVSGSDALGGDLRILHTSYLPADPVGLARSVLGFVIRSDGVFPVSLGLGAIAGVATWLVIARRDRLTLDARILAGAAMGWMVAGAVTLLIVTYRPSRYVVPLLPALAILVAVGWAAATRPGPARPDAAGSSIATSGRSWSRTARTRALAVLAVVILVTPGLLAAVAWSDRPSTLAAIQADALGMAIETPIQGKMAPAFAMRVAVPAIVSLGPDVNGGDLYATRGVRWVVASRDDPSDAPAWAAAHPAAWAARRAIACYPWPGTTYCLYRLP